MKRTTALVFVMQSARLKYFSLALVFSVVTREATSQFDYNKFISPSPTASSLGKYGDVPVSLYTGTPNVGIPIGELTGTELELSISMSYMARGVKVEDNASWVGTGWSLNAGGVITCTIRGHEDALGKPRPLLPMPVSAVAKSDILLNIQENFLDPEPDLFFFNFPGYSGSFVLDGSGNAVIDDAKDIRIVRDAVNKYKFTITIENGAQYIFDKIETTSYSGSSTSAGVAGIYLSRIVSSTGKEVINFVYAEELTKFYSLSRPVKRIKPTNIIFDAYPTTFSITTINSLRLTDITTNFGSNIQFIPESAPRQDLGLVSASVAPRALKQIKFYDRDGFIKKYVAFNYEVITTSRPYAQLRGTDPPANENTSYSNYRLYLKSLNEISGDGTKENPPHLFSYAGRDDQNRDLLPNKLSPAQDHWGYYNGSSNQDLWPGYSGPFGRFDSNFNAHLSDGCAATVGGQASFTIQGADREPRFPDNQHGTLTDVTYPTGARTRFEFEPHRYAYESSNHGYSLTSSEAIAQLFIPGQSSVLTDQVVVNANLAATITVQFAATCWNSNTHSRPYDCTAQYGQTDFDLFQENSIALFDAGDHEVASFKWIPGDGGFHVYKSGVVVGPAVVPDSEGNIRTDITGLNLPYGAYTFKIRKDPDSPTDIFAWFHYPSESVIDVANTAAHRSGGGLRIKKIETFDENGQSASVKTYSYGLGVLMDGPRYSTYVFARGSFFQPCDVYPNDDTAAYLEVSSGSHTALGQTQGSSIGYQTVTEAYNGNGSITYEYTTGIEYPDNPETEANAITYVFTSTTGTVSVFQQTYSFPGRAAWPYINQDNVDRKRGFLKKVTYRDEAGQDVMIKENDPVFKDLHVVYGLRMQTLRSSIDWLYSVYKYSSGSVNVARNVETQIQQTPYNQFSKIADFFYESSYHHKITKQTTTGSRGETEIAEFRYPDDYTGITDPNHPITQMKSGNLHMIGSPIETRRYLNGNIVDGNINAPAKFSASGGSFFVAPRTAFKIKGQITSSTTAWSVDPTNPDPSIFIRDTEFSYDANRNMTVATPRNQVPIAFLWETEIPSPVAQVDNAAGGSAYFSGFESSGLLEGGGSPAHTGKKYWNSGSYDFLVNGSFSPTNPSTLIMSYWYWITDHWVFSGNVPFANSLSSPGTRLDDIRVFPKGALMTTYNYEALVGMTSQTDPNNVTTYYRYDALGRLERVADNKGNILKKYTYHFNGQ